jgi:hypothetical protein
MALHLQPEGEGIYSWSDGSVYEGSWHEGLKHGWGKYTWPNGAQYKGEWSRGLLQVKGEHEVVLGVLLALCCICYLCVWLPIFLLLGCLWFSRQEMKAKDEPENKNPLCLELL